MNMLHRFFSTQPRTRIFLLFGLMLLIWNLWPVSENRQSLRPPKIAAAPSSACIELRPEPGPYQEVSVQEPGPHCIATDFWQRRLSGAGHSGPAPYRHLVGLSGGDVSLNLMNHVLHSDGHSSGIFAAVQSNRGSVINMNSGYGLQTKNIEIKNGVIDLRGLGTGIELINRWDMRWIGTPVPENFEGYEKSNIILENLLIKTDNMGIILEGDGNIIRNCVIESGGRAAISMAGPNGQIINNTIVLNHPFIPASMGGENIGNIATRNFGEFLRAKREPKAAIVLHQATGTVISGNRIEVKGKSSTRHNIYLTDASKDVRIEGNTFVGADDPVTLVKGSTATLKDNVVEQRKPWWKF